MPELEQLTHLLDADFVMSHQVAADLSGIACNLKKICPDYFVALFVTGSTVHGGAVAKSILANIDPKKAMSDVDYGVIFSRQISASNRCSLDSYINDELNRIGFASCETFNAKNLHLIADCPPMMIQRMLDAKQSKAPVAARYLAERLLMPYGVLFPLSGAEQIQTVVVESLDKLAKVDLEFRNEIIKEMNNVQIERRRIKEKHVSDLQTREFLTSNRAPASIKFN